MNETPKSNSNNNTIPFSKEVLIVISSISKQFWNILSWKWFSLITEDNRSSVISVLWRWLHLVFWQLWNLYKTSNSFLSMTNTTVEIDDSSKVEIEKLRKDGKGIIISNHSSWIFTDYLPLFAQLWEEVLNKCIFYTWDYNLEMNKREFPNLSFRSATIPNWANIEYVKSMKEQLEKDVESIIKEWWYIFMIASWANNDENAKFLSLFTRVIKLLEKTNENVQVLANKVTHSWNFWYKQVLSSLLKRERQSVSLKSKLTNVSDWTGKNWVESRDYYNSLF